MSVFSLYLVKSIYRRLGFRIPVSMMPPDFRIRYSAVSKYIVGDRVLDVGSGALGIGHFVRGKNVVCVDTSSNFVTAVGDRVMASATALPFRDKIFDTAVCVDMIEHISINQRKFTIGEIMRVCRRVVLHFPSGRTARSIDIRLHLLNWNLALEHVMNRFDDKEIEEYSPILSEYTVGANLQYIVSVLLSIPFVSIFIAVILRPFVSILNKPPYYGRLVVIEN